MGKYLSFVLFVILISACQSSPTSSCVCTDLMEEEGIWMEEPESPYSGSCETFYPNGNRESSAEFIEGKMNGHIRFYFETGELEEDLEFKENENTGKVVYYYKSGQIKMEGNAKNGEQFGEWTEYYEDGTIAAINQYEFNILHGWCKSFFKNGTIEMEGEMIDGKENGKWLFYDSLGVNEAYWVYDKGEPIEQVWLKD